MKFCTSCGKELKDNAKFCSGCGAKCIAIVPETAAPIVTTPEVVAPVADAPEVVVPVAADPEIAAPAVATPEVTTAPIKETVPAVEPIPVKQEVKAEPVAVPMEKSPIQAEAKKTAPVDRQVTYAAKQEKNNPTANNAPVYAEQVYAAENQQSANNAAAAPKKKRVLPIIIAAVLSIAILAGAGIFAVPKLMALLSDRPSDETANKPSTDSNISFFGNDEEDEIAAIIAEADILAAAEDYEGAIAEVKAGQATYPADEELQKKLEEYIAAQNAQIKQTNLDEAKKLADAGDYVGAMAVIQTALDTYGEDADYTAIFETYNQANKDVIKAEALSTAKELAEDGDYWGAYTSLEQAIATLGKEEELSAKAKTYEEAYVLDACDQVAEMIADNDVSNAKDLLKNALDKFPDNQTLKDYKAEVDKYKTVLLNALTPINGGFTWNDGLAEDPFGNSYTEAQNYVILHSGYSGWSGHGGEKETHTAEYQVNQEYDTISFNIVPYSEFGEDGWTYVQIYADKVLRYTSDKVFQKTQPYNICVDISDATYIEIIVYTNTFSCTMMTDVMLSKLPNFESELVEGYTSLSLIDVFNGSLSWNGEYPEDALKTAYNNVKNYAILHAGYSGWSGHGAESEQYSVEYYTNKKYSSLSMDVAPAADFGEEGSAVVKFYVNDELVHTVPTVTQKTERFNTGEIDISEADYVKIVVEVKPHGCIIISDVLLENVK